MVRIREHGHCENCGDPVEFEGHFCSDACSEEYQKDVKEAKRLDTRFYFIMGAGVAATAIVAFAIKYFVL